MVWDKLMPTVSITWHTQHDDAVCPICKDIDNYKWEFTESVPDSLYHPKWGEVWNISTGSLTHEHRLHKGSKYGLLSTCRCHVTGKVESLSDLADAIHKLKLELQSALGEGER